MTASLDLPPVAFTTFECPICKDPEFIEEIKHLRCTHSFHTTCIDSWLASNPFQKRCPVCRLSIDDEIEEDSYPISHLRYYPVSHESLYPSLSVWFEIVD